ncbi:undecaprenyldiphospho-muramoylpentapeptide beta-N-acetylglucosaminyltransferase [Salinimonas lutimaris]|uniref:undecaprenyldiphospho-muramoylpentapeptide beta-N-acetylglucosaminyltransferase n=1 Tax=Salinimonas lutimaris TaxID=914153 RepID=UPI0010C03390|nr:undecaprenyldiphospho-muramoylpentapeptide beta-N-acetylglucosaminyltransferase [Salinimonas lutimaris]
MSKRCLIMAGGTGGHVFPALAVATELREQGWDVQWLGTAERMEAQLVPKHDFPIHFLPVKGLRGKGLSARVQGVLALAKSLIAARRLIKKLKPDLVVGFGGYASGPGGAAAWSAGVPVVIHEQNAAIGMTNKLLGKLASKILLGFAEAAEQFGAARTRCITVGNPVRPEICALPQKVSAHTPLRLLVVGGSLGSVPLNTLVPEAVASQSQLEIWHQSGRGNQAALEQAYDNARCQWRVTEFIDDMAAAYHWADVIICRAGALTVAEVAAAGLTAVFVPLPHAVDDHQTKNAAALVKAGAATLIPQTQLAEQLPGVIATWTKYPQQCVEMGAKARALAITDATNNVVKQCRTLLGDTA